MDHTTHHRFPALTGIRFPLAVWVISYHIGGSGQMWSFLTGTPSSAAFMSKAYVALGTFFALSGFLLSHAYLEDRWNAAKLGRYLAARIARIAPLYYFSLLIVAPIIWNELRASRFEPSAVDAFWGYMLLLQGWIRFPVDWNTPAWSLSCELFYYACLPLIAFLLPERASRSAVLLTVAGFGLPILVRFLQLPVTPKPLTYFGDFVIGMACAAIYKSQGKRAHWLNGRGYWLYIPGGVFAVALLTVGGSLPWLAFDELMRAANAAVVLGLVFGGGSLDRALSSRLVMIGGAASFAAYILHVPVLWWFRRVGAMNELPGIPAGIIYMAAVWIVAVAAFRWIEEPANALLRRLLTASPLRPRIRALRPAGLLVRDI